ncbi:MAG: cytochrome c biogenesis protein ResB [Chloroflexi bacterium]|nr:cytochrome c biogenesis protein ResB [Chloroflexota bacterium]
MAGVAAWRTLTSVRFAVLQIIVLAVAGLIGTMVRQVPSFALKSPADYARAMADEHARYDPITILGLNVGPGLVNLFDTLGFFRIFSAPWFTVLMTLLVISIVVCTIDRTPRLWRGVRHVRVEQPPAFFDPRLPQRAHLPADAVSQEELAAVLRGRRFRLRRAVGGPAADRDGETFVMGDRNQYFKMATLFTHLGLILFLTGGLVTGAFGYETVLFVGEGQTAPVQPVGTPHNLLVKNHRFEAPTRPNGTFADFWTDLAVYRDGAEIARKTIRVNDPLSAGGFVFHQNTFGPAAALEIRDPSGELVWTGPVLLSGKLLELPQGFMTIPGSDLGLLALLFRDESGQAVLGLQGLAQPDPSAESRTVFLTRLAVGQATDPAATAGYRIRWTGADAFTGMVVKNDPGQGLIWLAYLSLMAGLVLTFYFPRRRVWARFTDEGVDLAMAADRYVDARREFSGLLDDLAARTGHRAEVRPIP